MKRAAQSAQPVLDSLDQWLGCSPYNAQQDAGVRDFRLRASIVLEFILYLIQTATWESLKVL